MFFFLLINFYEISSDPEKKGSIKRFSGNEKDFIQQKKVNERVKVNQMSQNLKLLKIECSKKKKAEKNKKQQIEKECSIKDLKND